LRKAWAGTSADALAGETACPTERANRHGQYGKGQSALAVEKWPISTGGRKRLPHRRAMMKVPRHDC
jgi:hypothetical protein